MTRFLTVIALCFFCVAGTFAKEPPCWPKQMGSTGSNFKQGETPLGYWIGWTCQIKGAPSLFGFMWKKDYAIRHPDVKGMTPIQTAKAYYALNVRDDFSLDPIRWEMKAAFGVH
jgi:hypothetical protein